MLKALVFKELRETGLLGLLALAVGFYNLASVLGYDIPHWAGHHAATTPFIGDGFVAEVAIMALFLAVALGLMQSYAESARGTWLWLLHRPIGRNRVIAVKLAVGTVVYVLCAAPPLAVYALWAATPRTHASPFEWSMTIDAWRYCFAMLVMYFAAFLSGVWPGRWWGARLLPFLGVGVLAYAGSHVFDRTLPLGRHWEWAWLALLAAASIYATLFVVRSRDFS
ncbi:MAG TPA: hypothetical protein VF306_06905 [Pirellulales bacterium]